MRALRPSHRAASMHLVVLLCVLGCAEGVAVEDFDPGQGETLSTAAGEDGAASATLEQGIEGAGEMVTATAGTSAASDEPEAGGDSAGDTADSGDSDMAAGSDGSDMTASSDDTSAEPDTGAMSGAASGGGGSGGLGGASGLSGGSGLSGSIGGSGGADGGGDSGGSGNSADSSPSCDPDTCVDDCPIFQSPCCNLLRRCDCAVLGVLLC